MQNGKRILSVKIKRMTDTDPDTSYLGKYSDSPKSEYAIDRAHSKDCASLESNHRETIDKLERIIGHLDRIRTSDAVALNPDNTEWQSLDEAIDILVALQNDAMECDCSGGDMRRNEFRYFNGPIQNYEGQSPEDIRKYLRQDYERMEQLNAGDWFYIVIRAEAEVQVTGDTVQLITSGGLWGIESDNTADYLKSVEAEELSNLKSQLTALGFSKRAIATAFKSVEEVSE